MQLDESPVKKKIQKKDHVEVSPQKFISFKRGISRSQPICWYNATLQLLHVINWPISFENHALKSKDAFAATFRMILELNSKKRRAISAQTSYKAAQTFIKYVNFEKQKALSSTDISHEPAWSIALEQDAQESMTYFLNMIADVAKPTKTTAALKVAGGNKKNIREMQNFVAHNFASVTKETMHCKLTNKSHVTKEEPHYMLTLGVPEQKEEVPLQDLVDVIFADEPIEDVQCEECTARHTCFKKLEMKHLTDQYLLLHLARFVYNDSEQQAHKIETPVNFSKPVVLGCEGTYFAFKVIAAINHSGISVHHGHYTVDKYVSGVLHNFNDSSITRRQEFNHKQGYVLLLNKMHFSAGSVVISRYLSHSKKQKEKIKNLQKKLNIIQSTEKKSSSSITSNPKKKQNAKIDIIKPVKSICKSHVFEILNKKNGSTPASEFPKGLTKRFISSLLQLQRKGKKVTVTDFWQHHSVQKQQLKQKHVDEWAAKNISVTFNNAPFSVVWKLKPKEKKVSGMKRKVCEAESDDLPCKKAKVAGTKRVENAEYYQQFKTKIAKKSMKRYKKHKEELKQKRQQLKADRGVYLQSMDSEKFGKLHEQKWTKKATKAFHKKMNRQQLQQCTECQERWYTRLDYKPTATESYLCTRCKRELKELTKPTEQRKFHVTRFGKDNDMLPGNFPECVRKLTQIEELLVSPILTCMPVYTVKGGSKRMSGNCINFVQHTEEIVNILPRLPSQLDTLIIHAPGYKVTNKAFKVNKERVRRFCEYAKSKKLPGWETVSISAERINKLPEDGIPDDLPTMIDAKLNETDVYDGPKYNEESEEEQSETEDEDVDLDETKQDLQQDAFAPCMISMPELKKKEKQKIKDALDWPTRDEKPVDEFRTVHLAAKCFPTLFPNGTGDPTNKARQRSVSFREAIRHLLKVAYKREDGTWYYPYAAHPRFSFWALNLIHRHTAIENSNIYLKKNPNDKEYTVEELLELLKANKKPPAFVRRLQSMSRTITGSPSYWYTKSTQLKHGIEQTGCGTLFLSYSMADLYWPELHRLLGTENANQAQRRRAILDNPHIVNSFFIKKLEAWNKTFFHDILECQWIWLRYENQGRGTIHAHMMVRLKNDPDLIELCEQVRKGRDSSNQLQEKDEDLTDEEITLHKLIVAKGLKAENEVINFCDTLITTMNPLSPDDREKFDTARGRLHPCAKSALNLSDDQVQQDYIDLINSVQRHKKCTNYCLQGKKGKKRCKFGFPRQHLSSKTTIDFEKHKDGHHSVILNTKTNDEIMNKHNRVQIQNWRANCDMQLILDWRACSSYLAKYSAKAEKQSKHINQILGKILKQTHSLNISSTFRKMMIATMGQVDRSHQETVHLLMADDMKLVQHEQWEFTLCHLKNDKEIKPCMIDGKRSFQIKKTIIDFYAERSKEEDDLNLHRFIQKWQIVRRNNESQLQLRAKAPDKQLVVDWRPIITAKPGSGRYSDFCRQELIKYRPWRGHMANAWRTNSHVKGESEKEKIMRVYALFMKEASNLKNIPKMIARAAQIATIELEDDEIEAEVEVEPEIEGWEAICKTFEQHPELLNADDNVDWTIDATKYKNQIENMLHQYDEIRELENKPIHYDIDVKKFTKGQHMAYDLITKHCFNKESKQLLLSVLGGAGTGKSYLIKSLKNALKDAVKITATTGLAAFNIHGTTVHSALSLPIRKMSERELTGTTLERLQQKLDSDVIKYLIIDEVSMLSQKNLKFIDKRLKQASGKTDLPFGGYNIILFGDFGQLLPVCGRALFKEPPEGKEQDGYILYRMFKQVVLLEKIERQSGDDDSTKRFRRALKRLRAGKITIQDWKFLMQRSSANVSAKEKKDFEDALRLFTTNEKCAEYNLKKLVTLGNPIAKIEARHEPSSARHASDEQAQRLQPELYLCREARVMLTRNICTQQGLTNGSFGTVKAIIYDSNSKPPDLPLAVVVQFPSFKGRSCLPDIPNCVAIKPETAEWYTMGKRSSRTQIPLRLAWAITVHKSQGMTLDRVVIDLEDATWATGLEYVAFSRVRAIQDLIVVPFSFDVFRKLNANPAIQTKNREDVRLQQLFTATKATIIKTTSLNSNDSNKANQSEDYIMEVVSEDDDDVIEASDTELMDVVDVDAREEVTEVNLDELIAALKGKLDLDVD